MRLIMPAHIDPNHPIATQEYAIYTPPMDELIETIGNWIKRKESGGYSFSPSRYGKSRAIKWFIRDALEERFNSVVPLVIWVRRNDMLVTESEFWNEILLATGFVFSEQKILKTKSKFREEALNRMLFLARNSESNYIVLVIDEAHDMTVKEWRWLLGLQNHLDFKGIRLSVFSIGTQQIGYQHNYLEKTGNAHISARFLVCNSRFYGLRDESELKYVMEGYDRESEWPPDSGLSYLRYFSPENFSKGLRLADCSEVFWKALCELIPRTNRNSLKTFREIGIPMKHVALSIEEVLWRLAEGEEWTDVTSYSSWENMIIDTGYVGHLKAISAIA